MRLRKFPCCPLGALVRSEDTWPMEQSTLEKAWEWVGQVDPFWTNIGEKQLIWGFTITVKVYGIEFLVELARLVRYYMQIKGNFNLTVVFTGVAIPTTLREIGWPKASCAKASFSQF